ncbi:MAG: Ig-like domain-containing protein [Pseudomonadota bacterium]
MAEIIGTAADDQLTGTTGDDSIQGGAGKDKLKGGDGNDVVDGGDGNDYVYGDAGNDILYGGLGNDALVGDAGDDEMYGEDDNDGMFGGGGHDRMDGGAGNDTMYGDGGDDVMCGGAGDDKLYGGAGNDRLDGGEGDDLLDGGAGNDTLGYRVGTGVDQLFGGTGVDALELVLTSADLDAVRGDVGLFADWLEQQLGAAGGQAAHAAQASGPTFTFASLGLTVSGFETFNIMLDGKPVSIDDVLNAPPVIEPVQELTTTEDVAVTGQVLASDPDGDALSCLVSTGPAHGTVAMDAATGAFTYTPGEGFSGSDAFTVTVTDAYGASVEQQVRIGVEAVADAPTLVVADPAPVAVGATIVGTAGNDVIAGTAGDDVIAGGGGNDIINGDGATSYTVALDIAAALNDADGSETLSVEIGGVPDGATLSAGAVQGDGTWLLAADDLPGLEIKVATPADFTVTVTATATDAGGVTTSVSESMAVTFEAGAGNDVISGGAGNDTLDGGAGHDLVDMSGAPVGVIVDLGFGTAVGDGIDTLANFEGVIGSAYGDVLTGNGGDNTFYDGAGNDNVYGGSGNDTFHAGSGSDRYNGGLGVDIVDYSAATGAVEVDLGSGTGKGGAGADKLIAVEGVVGSAYADTLRGDKGDNLLSGGAGDDVLRGMRGADVLTGGAGADTFQLAKSDVVSGRTHYGVDTITDFGVGDRLDFSQFFSGNVADIADVIRVTETADGTMLRLDAGSGVGFVDVVFLGDVFDLDLEFLEGNGQIIV